MNDRGSQARKIRVCIVAPVHVWDDVRVFHKQAVTLAAAGYDIALLAQARGGFVAQDVAVSRVWAPRTPRVLRFLCLPAVLVQALTKRADIYHLHNPDTLPLCFALKLLGRRVVYDTHEDFSLRIGIREWIPRPLQRLATWSVVTMERLAGRIANAVITTQEGVASRLGDKAVVIGNAPRSDPELLDRVRAKGVRLTQANDGALRAIYIGLVNEGRGLFEMIQAVEEVNRRHRVRLLIIGPSVAQDLAQARTLPGWRHVEYHERMPQEDAFALVSGADVGLAVVRDIADFSQADPNKLYEYMALSKPFIASDFPRWRARLDGADAGWFVPPGDTEALAAALTAALDADVRKRKGEVGTDFVKNYNWERESAKLLAVYRRVLPN